MYDWYYLYDWYYCSSFLYFHCLTYNSISVLENIFWDASDWFTGKYISIPSSKWKKVLKNHLFFQVTSLYLSFIESKFRWWWWCGGGVGGGGDGGGGGGGGGGDGGEGSDGGGGGRGDGGGGDTGGGGSLNSGGWFSRYWLWIVLGSVIFCLVTSKFT